LVTQSDAATALTRATARPSSSDVAPMLSSIVCSSMLMLENALHSYHRTCLQLQPFHSSFISIALARKRSSTLELENVLRSSLLIVAHAIENALRVLRSSMLPCSRTPLAFIVAHACNRALRSSSLLMLATALCTLIVHSSSLIVAHPIKHIHVSSNVRTSCVHPRSSWRTSCVRRCSSMLML
jgi:hypothetical protein